MGFRQEVTRSIGKVLKQNGYKMEPLSVDCIYFIKRYSDELAFYVRCKDFRVLTNGGGDIKFFFAPIWVPDDSIIRLNMGLYVNVLEVNADEWTDEILIGAGKKIVTIEKKLGGLSEMIKREMEYPYFSAGIINTYKDNLLIYNMVMKEARLEEDIIILKNTIYTIIRGKKRSPIYDLCSELIDKLPDNYFKESGIDMEMDEIKKKFTRQLWAHCLLDA